jgi:hypothetical protein
MFLNSSFSFSLTFTQALRVKDKMLDDQNDTIHQLKAALKEKVIFLKFYCDVFLDILRILIKKDQDMVRSHKLEDEINGLYYQLEDAKHKEKQVQQDLENRERSIRDIPLLALVNIFIFVFIYLFLFLFIYFCFVFILFLFIFLFLFLCLLLFHLFLMPFHKWNKHFLN